LILSVIDWNTRKKERRKERRKNSTFFRKSRINVGIYILFFLVKLYEMKFKENNPQKRREGKSGGTKGG